MTIGTYRDYLLFNKDLFNKYIVEKLLLSLDSVKNVEGFFLNLAEKSFGILELSKVADNPSLFFKSLGKDRSYITLSNILESIFASQEIKIENIDVFNLKITVINKNQKLLGKYIGLKNEAISGYIDKSGKRYKNFKAGEYDTLEEFITVFLSRFIPINKKIKEFNIVKNEEFLVGVV